MSRNQIDLNFTHLWPKRLNMKNNSLNFSFKFPIILPPIIEMDIPTKNNSISNIIVQKKTRKQDSLKKLLEIMNSNEKLSFHSDLIYLRHNLYNSQIKRTKKSPKNLTLNLNHSKPKKEDENFVKYKKFNISQDKDSPKLQKNSEIPYFLGNKSFKTQKKPYKHSLFPLFDRFLPKKTPQTKIKIKNILKSKLSPTISFSNDIEGWT